MCVCVRGVFLFNIHIDKHKNTDTFYEMVAYCLNDAGDNSDENGDYYRSLSSLSLSRSLCMCYYDDNLACALSFYLWFFSPDICTNKNFSN